MDYFSLLFDNYSDSQQHPLNKTMHLIGIPCVLFSTLLFFSWIHLSMAGVFEIHTSWLFGLALIIFYFRLDRQLAFLFAAILIPFIFLSNLISQYSFSFLVFSLLFATGWILQFVGYLIEGQQPAFIGRPRILPVLPLLQLADLIARRGYRSDIRQQ